MKSFRLVILFGSRVSGKTHPSSDADVAVLGDAPLSISDKEAAREKIAKKLRVSEDAVDVIDLWNAPPLLEQEIASKGKLLEGAQKNFTRFRVLAWKRYQDTAKFRRARSRALAQSLHVR